MSNTPKGQTPKPPIPKRCFIIALVSIYFFYKSYGRFNQRDYDAGIFYVLTGLMLLAATYSFYRNSRY